MVTINGTEKKLNESQTEHITFQAITKANAQREKSIQHIINTLAERACTADDCFVISDESKNKRKKMNNSTKKRRHTHKN